jgi:thiamine-monophosphate kinase
MKDASRPYNIILLGGDTVGADSFFIDISMVGKLVTKKYLGRDKAREGDLIAVTGYLGEAAYGLHLLLNGIKEKGTGTCIKRFLDPRSPYALWKELIKRDITVAMMDVSDGLIIDLERMMVESKKSAHVDLENIPVPTILKKNGMEKLALTGGEDYQLLLTFSPKKLPQVKRLQEEGHKISIIGKVAKGRGVKLFKNSKEILLTEKGYQHFNGKPHE